MLKKLFQNLLKRKPELLLIIVGSVSWSLTMVKSGLVYSFGMGFWGPNGHDGIWHIALAESISKGTWEIPVFAGETIKNYHIGFDLLLAIIHKISLVPVVNLYFQVIPPIFALLTGLLVYRFVLLWRTSKSQAWWATFFVYFGGSLGWIISLLRDGKIEGESLFWAQQSISTLVNPPFALSLILIFIGLNILFEGLEKKDKKLMVLAIITLGILVQVKIYAGILVLCGIFCSGIWRAFEKRSLDLLKVFGALVVVSVVILIPVMKDIGSTLIFRPFWFIEEMMSTSDRFYWPKFAEAMVNYKLGGVWGKAILAYGFAFTLFIVGNFGTRIFAFFWVLRRGLKRDYQYIDVLIVTVILTGILVPIFFVQSGTSWNTIQFMYYSLVFSGIIAGVWLGEILEKIRLNNTILFFVLVIVLFTIPSSIGTLWYHYLPGRPPAKVSLVELEALGFLRNQPSGIVLVQPFDIKAAGEAIDNPPRPLYLYESSAYVSAFSAKPTYLEDQVNLEITGYNWKFRRAQVERFFKDPTFDGKFELLQKRNISYVYVSKKLQKFEKDLHLDPQKVFENSEVIIYEVK